MVRNVKNKVCIKKLKSINSSALYFIINLILMNGIYVVDIIHHKIFSMDSLGRDHFSACQAFS